MKAIAQAEYGSPDVLKLTEVERPLVQADTVLVRVYGASINAGDWHLMRGRPLLVRLMMGGLLKPKIQIIGFDIAGTVEAVGSNITRFQPGDEVFGDLSECGFGAFAEYAHATEAALALKPKNLTFAAAAAVPGAAMTALQALRDIGNVQPGQQVLINGASGGVGSYAVQLAKAFGAEVTAVCSREKMDRIRPLGADRVLDYAQVNLDQNKQTYDLIVDVAAYRSVYDYLPALKPQGIYVLVGGAIARLFQVMILGALISKMSDRTVKSLMVKPNSADLATLRELIEAGKIVPLIDRSYSLEEVPVAIRQLEQRQVVGKVAIHV
ncbi:NAD(P)-dependent alcohol dehydrogenase [Nodosilinea sp. LEGE 07088]|uniref:NAD(P)-dependent alcohol dehydrogenase n=1 Tax=Nodosilinea sp. LEGE 07088 TaxID=2777968 RepID=UPI001882959B|nr:NAD(P)-dependent alcohol dehydrogenase [Nodosilinea sp. LEGE 07088]MBE9139524.1 NAD(P)-dependent alcohol dehydrogenase [Nodosilinea sp. LEGE 07088]